MYPQPQHFLPGTAFTVPNTVISNKPSGGSQMPATNNRAIPQMALDLTHENQPKILEDYKRGQVEENLSLKAQVEDLMAEKKMLQKEIASHRIKIK